MNTFLVTGGAGFIGSNLTEHLIRAGHKVTVLDNLITGNEENLSFIEELSKEAAGRFSFIKGDIRDTDTLKAALNSVEYVLHQAALPSVTRSVENPSLSNDININGTLNVLEAVRAAGSVKKVVYAASSSAYGDTPILPKVETMPPNPLSPYALQKFTGEQYMKIFSDIFGVKTVSLRYFNVFGPKQSPKSLYAAVIPRFIEAFLNDKRPTVYGDGSQSRDFTYIDNVIQANLKAAYSSDETNGMVFNIACGSRMSLNELIKILEKIFNRPANAEYETERPGDVKHSLADIGLSEKYLKYSVEASFEEGLRKTVEYFKENMAAAANNY